MHAEYRNPTLRQLRDQQVRFVPRDKRIEQVDRAEKLLQEIEASRTYTYEYLCYRITDYRPEVTPNCRISGDDAAHDLRLFVEDVSDSANVPAEAAGERVLTVDELSAMFNVSTKTISRWRRQGLVSRRFVFDGRKRVGFLQRSVDQFVKNNSERIKRGERFSQLTVSEREEIVERARRLARAGGCPSEVTRRIARRMGRSVETIRYTLKQFDQQYPDLAIFPEHTGPLSNETKEKIYQQYRLGVSIDALAKRYCRTKTSVYRVVNEMRAIRILELPLDFMSHDSFADPEVEREILGPMPPGDGKPRKARIPS
jgi:RNA polymerase primary sigma factor/RNA polymerase sigma factor